MTLRAVPVFTMIAIVGLGDSDEVLRVTFHKAITSAKTLPLQYRRQSKQWLEAHHYHSLDERDL
jgi:hypothetical protein